MARRVEITDLDDEVYAALRRRADDADTTVERLLADMAGRLVLRSNVEDWLHGSRRRRSTLSIAAVHEAFGDRDAGPA